MSRHTVTVTKGTETDSEATIGYDLPLQTYFLQAFHHPETDVPEVQLGTATQRLASLEQMQELARWNGYEIRGLSHETIVQLTKEAAAATDPRIDFCLLLGKEVARALKIIVQQGVDGWGFDPMETGNRNLDTMPARSGFATAEDVYRHIGKKAHAIAIGDLDRYAVDVSYLPDIDEAYEKVLTEIV